MAELLLALRLLLSLLMYAFLGVVLYTLWRELRQGVAVQPSRPAVASLTVERGAQPGQRFPLRPVTALGRAEDNDLPLADPFASAHHALIFWRESQWWLEDLGSHNGTLFNGERLDKPVVLTTGDRLRIGETELRFELEPTGSA